MQSNVGYSDIFWDIFLLVNLKKYTRPDHFVMKRYFYLYLKWSHLYLTISNKIIFPVLEWLPSSSTGLFIIMQLPD
jgi:hypothetical protein